MVVPVPVVLQEPQVKTLAPDVFSHIDQLSAPRLVEYWEQDPCYQPDYDRRMVMKSAGAPMMRMESKRSAEAADLGVTIEAKFAVGEYQILILSAKDSSGLDTWLRQNHYKIPPGADAALAPYIRDQMKFTVPAHFLVDISKHPKAWEGFRNRAAALSLNVSAGRSEIDGVWIGNELGMDFE